MNIENTTRVFLQTQNLLELLTNIVKSGIKYVDKQ